MPTLVEHESAVAVAWLRDQLEPDAEIARLAPAGIWYPHEPLPPLQLKRDGFNRPARYVLLSDLAAEDLLVGTRSTGVRLSYLIRGVTSDTGTQTSLDDAARLAQQLRVLLDQHRDTVTAGFTEFSISCWRQAPFTRTQDVPGGLHKYHCGGVYAVELRRTSVNTAA